MSSWSEECAVVIPCLNEAGGICSVVRHVREQAAAVMVVDDGSTDGTTDEALRAGALVKRHERPCGKGAALRSGFQWAWQHGFSWALAMDGDGQHAAEDIPRFREAFEQGSAAMVVGNRMENARHMPWVRRRVNRWMSRRLSDLCGQSFPDSQCGFRLVDLRRWREMRLAARYFEIESELLVRFAMAGLEIQFVPVATLYGGEQSKIHPLRDTIRWFRWLRAMKKELRGQAAGSSGAGAFQSQSYGSIVRDPAL